MVITSKMTDWSKFKVTELKEECKTRDIPLTGLKLKQQLIDALEKHQSEQEQEAIARASTSTSMTSLCSPLKSSWKKSGPFDLRVALVAGWQSSA